MTIYQTPAAMVFLVNLIICAYALARPQPENTRVFQLVMGAALLCWSGGVLLYWMLEGNAAVFILSAVANMLVPANYLAFALAYPTPVRWVERHRFPLVLLYFPALILVCLTNYSLLAEWHATYGFCTALWERNVWTAIPLYVLSTVYLGAAAGLFQRRMRQAKDPHERDLLRYFLYSFLGVLVFAAATSLVAWPSRGDLYPSFSMFMALIGQLGLFWMIRCLHEQAPENLSRAVFLPLLALVIVFVILLIDKILEAVLGGPSFTALQLSLLMLVSVSVSLILVLFREELQDAFDSLFFQRAYRYRGEMRKIQAELTEARERLYRAQRMAIVGEVAASVAHEIKNPLGPIKGYTQMMMRTLEEMPPSEHTERFARSLRIIEEEVDNINERVRQLLEFSRSQNLECQLCRIDAIVQRAADLAQADASNGRSLEVIPDFESQLPALRADPARLHEAFFN
ncbi:MAG: hypothetical protein NTW86_24185, partial [Candidatus Sumerlaeota bacterium]|nr:hypothetical protein [Candidatus Sumerlaeota bacterium]